MKFYNFRITNPKEHGFSPETLLVSGVFFTCNLNSVFHLKPEYLQLGEKKPE
jgi:hypothetical protein